MHRNEAHMNVAFVIDRLAAWQEDHRRKLRFGFDDSPEAQAHRSMAENYAGLIAKLRPVLDMLAAEPAGPSQDA